MRRLIGFCRDDAHGSEAKLAPEPAKSLAPAEVLGSQPEEVPIVQGKPSKSSYERGVARLREADKVLRGDLTPDAEEWAELKAVAEEVPDDTAQEILTAVLFVVGRLTEQLKAESARAEKAIALVESCIEFEKKYNPAPPPTVPSDVSDIRTHKGES